MRSAVWGDFLKKVRKPFLEKSCPVRLKKSRKCCPLSPSCLSPLQISDNREADVSEQESVFKAHLMEYRTQREAKRSPFFFSGHAPASSQYWPILEIENRMAYAWAEDKRQAVLPGSQEGASAAAPAELYFRGKVELPF